MIKEILKVYISGPISGMPGLNEKAFAEAQFAISDMAHDPINPFDVCYELGDHAQWHEYMKADLKAMLDAHVLLMLDGWRDSRGATIEHDLATQLQMTIYYNVEDLPPVWR